MNTAEQLENMIAIDVELGIIGTYKEEVKVWNSIFSSLYGEELNQAAHDFRLADVYCQIRDGVLDTLRNGDGDGDTPSADLNTWGDLIDHEVKISKRRTAHELSEELIGLAASKYGFDNVTIGYGNHKFYIWIDLPECDRQTIWGNYSQVSKALK